jgi:antitoxin MazE
MAPAKESATERMRLELVPIGNSKGIRIPKPIIEQCGFGETVQLHVQKGRLVIRPDRRPRHGWTEAFRRNAKTGDDRLILGAAKPNAFDSEEWEW